MRKIRAYSVEIKDINNEFNFKTEKRNKQVKKVYY